MFAAAAAAFVTLLYGVSFVVFHATSSCPSPWQSFFGGVALVSIFLLLFPIDGGTTAIGLGSLGLAGSATTLVGVMSVVGGLSMNFIYPLLFCH